MAAEESHDDAGGLPLLPQPHRPATSCSEMYAGRTVCAESGACSPEPAVEGALLLVHTVWRKGRKRNLFGGKTLRNDDG